MKKVVRTIATVALMFVVVTGTAKEPTLIVTPNADKSLNFEMDAASQRTEVTISDKDGVIIYSEELISATAYAKKFDLKNLPDGDYILKVEDALRLTVFEFDIENSKIFIEDRKENTKPIFRTNGEKVFLNLLNPDMADVKIMVYDSDNRVVFKEIITDTFLVEKAFNFEKAFNDTYMVVVKNGDTTFYEDIVVK